MLFGATTLHAQLKQDTTLFRAINNTRASWADHYFTWHTHSLKPVAIGLPAGFVATGLLSEHNPATKTGILLAAATGVNYGLTTLAKKAFDRPRPYESLEGVHKLVHETSRSFPSGHASTAFAIATTLSLRYRKWSVIGPSFGWALLMGYSRPYLGVHYPTDILGGMVLGMGNGYLVYALFGE